MYNNFGEKKCEHPKESLEYFSETKRVVCKKCGEIWEHKVEYIPQYNQPLIIGDKTGDPLPSNNPITC